jgi:hypothetical protein
VAWHKRIMGDAVIFGEEDKEAVEAEDNNDDNDEGMEEMEIKIEDDGKGVEGRRHRGAKTTTHNAAVVSHLAAAVGQGGDSTFPRLRDEDVIGSI